MQQRGLQRHITLARCGGALMLLGFAYILFLWWSLPDIRDASALLASQSTVIMDRNGTELYRLFQEQDRTFVPRTSLPTYVSRAVLAIEDERFFEHGCVDFRAITRAILANIFRGFKSQGASTLTQQLARNALLTREKRISRKIKEIFLACALERRYTKEELLELYLNWIPFGQNAYGVEQASRTYFGIPAQKLSLAQAAVLAALPQRPSYFNPYGAHTHTGVSDQVLRDIQRGSISRVNEISEKEITIGLLGSTIGSGATSLYMGGRADTVLRKMHDLGFIEDDERLQALTELEHITFTPYREDIRAPHFVLWIRDEVSRLLAGYAEEGLLEHGGLRIETTLDWELQKIAEGVITDSMKDITRIYGAFNAALVTVDVPKREILAYVGNADFNDTTHGGKIDMARVPRQPGSSFKPFTYAAAFQNGYGPGTILYDVPTKFGEDEPQNFDGKFWGPLPIRRALGASRNIPAVKAFFLAGGEEPILQLAAHMGVTNPKIQKGEHEREEGKVFDYGWPLGIGAGETPLLEMVSGYSTLAGMGTSLPLTSIRRISDRNGNILFEAPQTQPEQVLDARIAYQITSILSDPEPRPNEYWRNILTLPGTEAAAKTGTSNKCLKREKKEKEERGSEEEGPCIERRPDNLWTIGYTPALVTGVWVGNASNEPLAEKAESLVTAAPIWKAFMTRALQHFPATQTQFTQPPDLLQPQISLLSGELPAKCTPVGLRRAELFLEENAPTKMDPACTEILIDKVTGLRASDSCPVEAREEQSFLIPRSILSDRWPEWEKGVQEWAAAQMLFWNAAPDHSGSILPLPLAPTED
ncbi:penicillin-binding protein, partial [Candidatus Peregrinibacteria bacterium]|nr:penicillin-binding protein [Candidatus Peregrinibacteria bacterium]